MATPQKALSYLLEEDIGVLIILSAIRHQLLIREKPGIAAAVRYELVVPPLRGVVPVRVGFDAAAVQLNAYG